MITKKALQYQREIQELITKIQNDSDLKESDHKRILCDKLYNASGHLYLIPES